jgi:transposase InsO family protein
VTGPAAGFAVGHRSPGTTNPARYVRRAIVAYIAWYTGTRLHSALGYLTPTEFETATRRPSSR